MRDTEKIDYTSRNPALARGGVTGAVAVAVVLLARQLGLDPDVVAVVAGALGPLVAGLLIRAGVFSPATVADMLRDDRPPS